MFLNWLKKLRFLIKIHFHRCGRPSVVLITNGTAAIFFTAHIHTGKSVSFITVDAANSIINVYQSVSSFVLLSCSRKLFVQHRKLSKRFSMVNLFIFLCYVTVHQGESGKSACREKQKSFNLFCISCLHRKINDLCSGYLLFARENRHTVVLIYMKIR